MGRSLKYRWALCWVDSWNLVGCLCWGDSCRVLFGHVLGGNAGALAGLLFGFVVVSTVEILRLPAAGSISLSSVGERTSNLSQSEGGNIYSLRQRSLRQ